MKKSRRLLLSLAGMLSLLSCSSPRQAVDNEPEEPTKGASNVLVAYFSWSGNTRQVSKWISEETGGELFRIVTKEAYPDDYSSVADRAQEELRNKTRPELESHIQKDVMASYDTLFVGFPVWWYDLPMPVWSFLEEYDLKDKTVIPFFTHNGSSSGANAISTLKELCKDANVIDSPLSIRGSSVEGAKEQVTRWVSSLPIEFKKNGE